MEHKFSTFILLFILGVVGLTMLVSSTDGLGSKNVLAKFIYGDVIGNSSIIDDGNSVNVSIPVYVDGSQVCTSINGVCGSGNSTYNTSGLSQDIKVLKDVDLVGLTKTFCNTTFVNGLGNSTTCGNSETLNITFLQSVCSGTDKVTGFLSNGSVSCSNDLTSSDSITPFICYQEHTNITNQSGRDGSCWLRYTGTLANDTNWTNFTRINDGNWSNYAITINQTGNYWSNWSKPSWSTNQSNLLILLNLSFGVQNITFTRYQNCWNYSSVMMRMWIFSNSSYNRSTNFTGVYCYNGTQWQNILNWTNISTVHEMGFNWSITPQPLRNVAEDANITAYRALNTSNSTFTNLSTTYGILATTTTTANNACPKAGCTFTGPVINTNSVNYTTANITITMRANTTVLWNCTTANEGQLLYNMTTKKVNYCNSTTWVSV